MLARVPGDHRAMRALWPALLVAVLAYVIVDFVQSPFPNVFSDAVAAPNPHLTLWIAQTETSASTDSTVHLAADTLILDGQPANVAVLPGGSSRAIVHFLSQPQPPGQLLVISSNTLADLAQERMSALIGEEPLRAAFAERLLQRAIPVGLVSEDSLTIAVPRRSPIHSLSELMTDMRAAPGGLVFATTEDNWAADNLAALVEDAGVDGVVHYRVFPSTEEVSLALAGGNAEVVLAPRSTILADLRAGRLRALGWPRGSHPPPSWVELLASPSTPASQVQTLRSEVRDLISSKAWRAQLRDGGQQPGTHMSVGPLQRFLAGQNAKVASLQQVALRVERP
jgi:Tripartite tricarboxylate transporter family receptor